MKRVFCPAAVLAVMSLVPTSSVLMAADHVPGKARFASPTITARTPGHAIDVDADISGAKQLFLVVTDAGDGFNCDWADWGEPRLVGPGGEKKLTELRWKSA